ncbi:uncharacterized protein LOC110016280 [Oryzias latipes]|uniref:uncharacterized protein LOC110016280 n=1 Tax=Oryzias latipes TaxID=8090 RepID=UPI000CE2863A|nr:uncharacterized protein LOC110016280 [Oryzias latipes]
MMAENVLYVEIKFILDTLVEAAVDVLGVSGRQTGNAKMESGFGATGEMLSRETSRKICCVFSQMSSLLLSENSALKAQLERLEAELQSATRNVEDARRWRESVLSGCPVLFQQSGLLFRLKPFGRLMRRTDAQQEDGEDEESSSAAQVGRDDGKLLELRNNFDKVIIYSLVKKI